MQNRLSKILRLTLIILGLIHLGSRGWTGENSRPEEHQNGVSDNAEPALPGKPIEAAGVHNLFQLSPRLYSGSQPEGRPGFESLQRLGIRTIISVDGAIPDVEQAHQAGLRYVHLPVGYDGVSPEQAARLVKAMNSMPGPVFVHCHHGKHRGPTAAALCGLATEGWSKQQALDWLEQAGTSSDYAGLFETVRTFDPPSPKDLQSIDADFPERAKVPALIESMVEIDQRWDHLKEIQEAGFRSPPEHPDLDPPHEALQLTELFRELQRQPESTQKGDEFLGRLAESESEARSLEQALRRLDQSSTQANRIAVQETFGRAAQSCRRCHATFRDR